MASASASAAAGGAAHGGSNPNPSANGVGFRPLVRPVALADITNTGKPNPPRSVHSAADALKENAKLLHMLREKTKVVEVSRVEIQKLRLMLHKMHQQNVQLAQTNAEILAELNQGKDKLKVLQHELDCKKATLKVKAAEREQKNRIPNQPQNKANKKEEIKAMPSKPAPIEAHQSDNKPASARAHHLVETQHNEPSNTGSQEPTQDKINKSRKSKRKPESCEALEDTITEQRGCKPHLQSNESLHLEDPRKILRRSSRLNPGSFEITEVPYEAVVDSVISSSGVSETHKPNTVKDTFLKETLQKEVPSSTTAINVNASELKKHEINMHSRSGMDLEEIQASCPLAAVEAHQIGDKATKYNLVHLAETQSSLPCNIIEHPEPPQSKRERRMSARRSSNKQKLESCEGPKNSNIEDINAKSQSSSSEKLHHEDKRLSPRRKSAKLNPESFEAAKGIFESLHEDIVNPVAPPSSDVLIEESKKNEQDDGCRSSMKPSEEQVVGRRSSVGRPSRRAAEKIVSYKEPSLLVKMRRPSTQ